MNVLLYQMQYFTCHVSCTLFYVLYSCLIVGQWLVFNVITIQFRSVYQSGLPLHDNACSVYQHFLRCNIWLVGFISKSISFIFITKVPFRQNNGLTMRINRCLSSIRKFENYSFMRSEWNLAQLLRNQLKTLIWFMNTIVVLFNMKKNTNFRDKNHKFYMIISN